MSWLVWAALQQLLSDVAVGAHMVGDPSGWPEFGDSSQVLRTLRDLPLPPQLLLRGRQGQRRPLAANYCLSGQGRPVGQSQCQGVGQSHRGRKLPGAVVEQTEQKLGGKLLLLCRYKLFRCI